MPNYEFKCGDCEHTFTKIMKIDERDDPQACPECGSQNCQRASSTWSTTNWHGTHFKSQAGPAGHHYTNPKTVHLGYKTQVNKWGFNQRKGE